jgi:hypothetical protein
MALLLQVLVPGRSLNAVFGRFKHKIFPGL